jgi:hypothetical protein
MWDTLAIEHSSQTRHPFTSRSMLRRALARSSGDPLTAVSSKTEE